VLLGSPAANPKREALTFTNINVNLNANTYPDSKTRKQVEPEVGIEANNRSREAQTVVVIARVQDKAQTKVQNEESRLSEVNSKTREVAYLCKVLE